MIFNGREVPFPAVPKISFFKIFESLEALAKENDSNLSQYAKNLLQLRDKYPLLEEGFEDLSLLETYKEPIKQLTNVVFPDVLSTNEIKTLLPPFNFYPIEVSQRFRNIITAAGPDFKIELKGYDDDSLYIYTCVSILKTYYGFPVDSSSRSLIEIPDTNTNVIRTYRLTFNADMIEMIPTERAPEVSYEDYLELLDNFEDIALWKKKFPPESWIMRGLGMANLVDVTPDAALSSITSSLIIKTQASFENIEQSLRRLFNMHDLQSGFITYDNGTFVSVTKGNLCGLMLGKDETWKCTDAMCHSSYHQLINLHKPLVITDVEQFDASSNSEMSHRLKEKGLKSYIIAPLIHNDEFLGFLELGSKQRYTLSHAALHKLGQVLPLLSMAASRFKIEAQNSIEAIIQKECTTIHPSVKWRFEEEAKNYMFNNSGSVQAGFKDIVFKDVIPLYGQLDIRESSTKRNEAVKHDLIKQISGVRRVMVHAYDKMKLPVYEELIYRIDQYKHEMEAGLLAGSEQKILSFLKGEMYPLFDYFKKTDGDLAAMIGKYRQMLDPHLDTVYEMRKNFDESVTKINYTLATFLDEKQKEAQQMFPHYFERYKTDGIEYNIYIGQSIAKGKNYHPVYLHNLQIWQLRTMAEMEIRFRDLQKELTMPLDIASLILVYSTPLSVHFRMDEKKFDVEGAYNARYEIVKKRLDKAHIRGTSERITAPGKIAIIYSRDQDAVEYRRYIQFLQSKGYLKKSKIEDHALEDLQGITGLRALRVEVDYSKRKIREALNVEKIMKAIEAQN